MARQELQDRPNVQRRYSNCRTARRAHQPDRWRGPADLVARADEFPACDHRFDHGIGRAADWRGADRNPDHDRRAFRAGYSRPAASRRPELSQQPARRSSGCRWKKRRLDLAVNNMTQGLLLFDANQNLIICSKRYLEMYGLSARRQAGLQLPARRSPTARKPARSSATSMNTFRWCCARSCTATSW